MKPILTILTAAVAALVNAVTKAQATAAYKNLMALLKGNVSDNDRAEALQVLVRKIRMKVITYAQKHYAEHSPLYNGRHTALFEELASLQRKCQNSEPQSGDINALKKMPFNLSIISSCMTADSLNAFFKDAYCFVTENPSTEDTILRHLRGMVEMEAIAAYAEALQHMTSIPWFETYALDLLMIADLLAYHGYPLNLLMYGRHGFSFPAPEMFADATDCRNVQKMLKTVRSAVKHFSPELLAGYMMRLRENICNSIIETLITLVGGESKVPSHILFLISCLQEIEDGDHIIAQAMPVPADLTPLAAQLTAERLIHFLCIHEDDDDLKNDWCELIACAAASPCIESLMNHAYATISINVFSVLMDNLTTPLPEIKNLLIRLYLALTASGGTFSDDAEFRWIMNGVAS